MVEGYINENVITQRALWISQMIDALKDLPIENREKFFQNKHNIAAAESYVKRALEALFDIGQHILAKRFAKSYMKSALSILMKLNSYSNVL